MSHYYINPSHPSPMHSHSTFPLSNSGHTHVSARSRRPPRHSSQKQQIKSVRNVKDHAETTQAASFRKDFEAARSFDLEDDELFCPWHLLTEDDLHSIHSSSSDHSSSFSGSPATSPLQTQLQPTSGLALPSGPHPHGNMSLFQHVGTSQLKLHQPMAQRARNAIPIVDPNSRNATPPISISPNNQMQKPYVTRRW